MEFRVAGAETSGLGDSSADLITVAQALHWFDIDAFFREALRVLKPGGVLAVWSYHRATVNEACDHILEDTFRAVEPYWPPERELVLNRYRGIHLPVAELASPPFSMRASWTATDMLDYMRTWSAAQRYIAATGRDPVASGAAKLLACWGERAIEVTWPLTIRLGRK